jgi:dynein heavy chain
MTLILVLTENRFAEAEYCIVQVQNYVKTWEPFKDIWEMNKDLYIQR